MDVHARCALPLLRSRIGIAYRPRDHRRFRGDRRRLPRAAAWPRPKHRRVAPRAGRGNRSHIRAGRPRGERALRRCPLVDLAAMLRSLDLAAAAALRREAEGDRETLAPWAALWVRVMTETLAAEYFAAANGAPAIPPTSADREAL